MEKTRSRQIVAYWIVSFWRLISFVAGIIGGLWALLRS
jgi:hypothetical protein